MGLNIYPYTGATGKNDASRVLEVLRDETSQKLIEHGKAQDAIPDNSGQSNKQLKNSKDQQLRFNNTGYTNVPPPPEMPYKKYILFTPRDMFEFMNRDNPNRELVNV